MNISTTRLWAAPLRYTKILRPRRSEIMPPVIPNGIADTNTMASQFDVNWSVLGTRTTSWKNGERKYATIVIAAVTIKRVKITHPKSPLYNGAMKYRADSISGLRGPRWMRAMP